MPSAGKNGEVCKEKNCNNLGVLAKTPRLKRFFPAKLLCSNVKKRSVNQGAPEHVGQSFSTGVPQNI